LLPRYTFVGDREEGGKRGVFPIPYKSSTVENKEIAKRNLEKQ